MANYNNLVILFYLLVVGNATYFVWRYVPLTSSWQFAIPYQHYKKFPYSIKSNHAKELYLNSKYLTALKLANPKRDSKSIVDRATKRPLMDVLNSLQTLDVTNKREIEKFISQNLHNPGYEIVEANLTDWTETPAFIKHIIDVDLKKFSIELNKIWLKLYRKFDASKLGNGCVSSHLPMKHPFIVPGGRFIEMYYWDTYWTIEGLLVCEMFDTVRMMLENFIHFIREYGFIPNGSRIYYLNRSQPPYFSQMVMKLYEFSNNSSRLSNEKKKKINEFVLGEALSSMIKEHEYWMRLKVAELKINGQVYKLNVYKADTDEPRPESYFEDTQNARALNSSDMKNASKFYKNIATAAESGYDFSSRWFKDSLNMNSIQTTEIVPVDLNSILYKNEVIISELCLIKGNKEGHELFKQYALSRKAAINSLLWLDAKKCWGDLNLATDQINPTFYVSDLAPLWHGIDSPASFTVEDILERHSFIFHKHEGGLPYSQINSGQQWDYPNTWAPYHQSLVSFLLKHDRALALKVARKFFNSVHLGWLRSGLIYEKYDASLPGLRGAGGEYKVQAGFGWTNGVMLYFINKFRDELIN